MKLSGPVFSNHGSIPSKYTCDGPNISPPLRIGEVPGKAVSLTLLVHDPDSVKGDFKHWLTYDIPASMEAVPENFDPGIVGLNDFNRMSYGGPCPTSGNHRYGFRLYALDKRLDLPAGKPWSIVEQAMRGHIIEETELVGLYQREG